MVGLAADSVTDGNIAAWNGTTGKLLKDTGVAISSILTSESDPVFTASNAFGITGTDITNWNTAYGWGNHANAGYQTGSGTVAQANLIQDNRTATYLYVWQGTQAQYDAIGTKNAATLYFVVA
jgi:hypothetical protein